MNPIWPYVSFVLGAVVSLLAQWVSYRLSFKKDQKKEYWIRKLNSYQDFYQHTTHLLGLLRNGIQIPDAVFWQSISLARKAAFDAQFYDRVRSDRPKEMQEITEILIDAFKSKGHCIEFETVAKRIEGIQQQFYADEKLSWKTSHLRPPGNRLHYG